MPERGVGSSLCCRAWRSPTDIASAEGAGDCRRGRPMTFSILGSRHGKALNQVRRKGTAMPTIDLGHAAREVARLSDGVTEDQLAGPTPCPDYPVAALLDHLMGLSLAFTWAARKTTGIEGGSDQPGPGLATAAHLDPEWRTLLPRRLDVLVEAWRDPIAWEGMTEAGGVRMPAELMGV